MCLIFQFVRRTLVQYTNQSTCYAININIHNTQVVHRIVLCDRVYNSANGSYPDTTTIPVTSSSRVKFLAEGNKAIAISILFLKENTKFLFLVPYPGFEPTTSRFRVGHCIPTELLPLGNSSAS